MANPPTSKELFDLEKAFWGAMQKNDGKAAAALTAENCVLVGAQGASTINPSDNSTCPYQHEDGMLTVWAA